MLDYDKKTIFIYKNLIASKIEFLNNKIDAIFSQNKIFQVLNYIYT